MLKWSGNAVSGKLVPLSELKDFEVAEGQPDIRGWAVLNAAKERIGTVNELIVDSERLLVRYLNIKLSPEILPQPETQRHVLVPVGSVTLSSDLDEVRLPALTTQQVLGFVPYHGGEITRQYELELLGHLPEIAAGLPTDFYASAHFSSHGLSGPRFRGPEPDTTSNPEAV